MHEWPRLSNAMMTIIRPQASVTLTRNINYQPLCYARIQSINNVADSAAASRSEGWSAMVDLRYPKQFAASATRQSLLRDDGDDTLMVSPSALTMPIGLLFADLPQASQRTSLEPQPGTTRCAAWIGRFFSRGNSPSPSAATCSTRLYHMHFPIER